jgi:hypothetical protein
LNKIIIVFVELNQKEITTMLGKVKKASLRGLTVLATFSEACSWAMRKEGNQWRECLFSNF